MKRDPKNAGIEYKGKSKCGKYEKYRLTVYCGYDSNGKQIRKRRTVEAKGIVEARKLRAAFQTEVETGQYVAPSHTKLKVYAENQYLKHIEKNLSPNTVDLYKGILNNYIYEHLGHFELDKITHVHLNEYTDFMINEELSTSTVQKHHNLLNGLFKLAITNEVIANNPMEKVDKINVKYKKSNIYTEDEVKQFISLLNKEKNKQMALLLKLAVTTGMRRGELLALEWDDLDFSNNTITINKSLSYTTGKGYQIREPKTENSIRTISVSINLMNELKKHKLIKNTDRIEAKELWKDGKYFFVFSSEFGKPLFPSVPSRYLRRFLERTNFKKVRFHDLRHTHVNYLMGKGATLKDVSKRLGHASISTTVDIYGHLDRKKDEELANMFNEIL